jgi:putative acetyltransferase
VYYSRFGFEPTEPLSVLRASLRIPEPASQVVRLPGWHDGLSGMLVYPDPFWEFDCVGLR